MPILRVLTVCLFVVCPFVSRADDGFYRIMADDGTVIANHPVAAEVESRIEKLSDVIVVGNPNGRVTLVEFYDVNCPYCRVASRDLDALLRRNRELRLVLVPFPVLGIPSIQATRVELGVARLAPAQKFYEFHRLLDESRGTVDGARALAAAQKIGLDVTKVLAIANDDQLAEVMKEHLHVGDALAIQATPGFVIKGVAIVGYPGPKAMANIIAAVSRCGAVICEGGKAAARP